MNNTPGAHETQRNVLLHMYNRCVRHSIGIVAAVARAKFQGRNPRQPDLQALYTGLGAGQEKVFLNGVVAIAEFIAMSMLDFVERYNRFESENNESDVPRLELNYIARDKSIAISKFESHDLSLIFKEIARDHQVRQLIDSTISSVLASHAEQDQSPS